MSCELCRHDIFGLCVPLRFGTIHVLLVHMNKTLFVALALALALSGCGMVRTAVENKVGEAVGLGGNAGTVANLWPDVPPIDGATKSNLDLPLSMKVVVQGFMRASASNGNVSLDKFDFIAFKSNKTADQIAAVYTKEKMAGLGWNNTDTPGCAAGAAVAGAAAGGGICVFGKQAADGSGSGLIIAIVREDATKDADVWYVRFEGIKSK